MTDLLRLTHLSNLVLTEPTEEHLEAFLQAYNTTEPPANAAELVMFEVLGDITVYEYMDSEHTEVES